MLKKRMIMTRTPLRITFVGGGTDIGGYYRDHGPGAVISAAVNKYIHIVVNKKFDDKIRVSYSKTEIVDSVDELQHPTVREALKLVGIRGGVEIVSISDIPSGGTGLGSSSSFLVGLLNALHAWNGELVSAKQLAEEAVGIEVDTLGEPIGKQDQYIAAYGGIKYMKFERDDSVVVEPVIMEEKSRERLGKHLLLLYTGKQRSASGILSKQSVSMGRHVAEYTKMKALADKMYIKLSNGDWSSTGKFLHDNWLLKKSLSEGISDAFIDGLYGKAIRAGALGGKLIGAGGGGFLMMFAPPEKHAKIIEATGLRKEDFEFDALGSRVIYVGD